METVAIKKIIATQQGGFAVLLGNDRKTFPVFVGAYEGAALIREVREMTPPRPMTHDLIGLLLDGFSLEVKRIVITELSDSTFFACLVLEQQIVGEQGEWTGRRNEVRIDARPSDCFVIALKKRIQIEVEPAVFEAVSDVKGILPTSESMRDPDEPPEFEFDDDIDFDLEGDEPEGGREP